MRLEEFNTVAGITKILSERDLKGLFEIAEARREAQTRGDELRSFVIAGRFVLDARNSAGRMVEKMHMRMNEETYVDVDPDALKLVVDSEELRNSLEYFSYGYTFGLMPSGMSHDSKCPCCGLGWTLRTADDVSEKMHRACRVLFNKKEMREWYEKLAREVGFTNFDVELLSNEYWKEPTAQPWCKLHTRLGFFELGPRKRVYSLSWENIHQRLEKQVPKSKRYNFKSPIDGNVLFEKEDVTKERALVHAWGEEKLIEYMKTLLSALRTIDSGTL